MRILETRSEVKVAVALWRYATLIHPDMRAHTKFGIPTSNNIRNMLQTRFFLRTRSEVKLKVTVTRK